MSEANVNGTQADEAMGDGGEGTGVDEELLRQTHLSAMLTELVRRDGPTKTAELLGVSYKTVARAQKSGKVTEHMRDALERLLEPVGDAEAAGQHKRIGALEESVKRLEGDMSGLAKELRDGLAEIRDVVAGEPRTRGGDEAQDWDDDGEPQAEAEQEGAGRSETRAAPSEGRLRPLNPDTLQPLDPEIVTVEPADDDVEVYGAAWPLVEEWRRLRADHPFRGKSLGWLATEERLLVLELAMLEEHGLTMPPEKQPLRGFGRRGQTSWRWKTLADTRLALKKRKLLRWVLPWLWREKAPEPSPGPVSGGC